VTPVFCDALPHIALGFHHDPGPVPS
jgi:hypothetical protein